MKKVLLFAVAALAAGTSFAQAKKITGPTYEFLNQSVMTNSEASKTSGVGDTIKGRLNFPSSQLDTTRAYRYDAVAPNDSGFAYGVNVYGDKGFAERYNISGKDSSVRVYGVYAAFDGRVQPNSNKTITFSAWKEGNRTRRSDSATRPRLYLSGKPDQLMGSQTVSIRNLGIGANAGADTFKLHIFSTPSTPISDSFFVGYTANYTWAQSAGDTIGLRTTRDQFRYQPSFFVKGADTIINVLNAVQNSSGAWLDDFTQNTGLFLHYIAIPFFVVGPSGISDGGISNRGLTLFGNYPNPANTSTNVKFGLEKATKATLSITDMTGKILRSIELNSLRVGENIVEVNTAELPAGNYFYMLRTMDGAGMAAQMSVIH